MNGKKTFDFVAFRPGGAMNWPGQAVTSNWPIRATAVIVFRRWFGREPIGSWGSSRVSMAEAWDERGNRVELLQINRFSAFYQIDAKDRPTFQHTAPGYELAIAAAAPVPCCAVCRESSAEILDAEQGPVCAECHDALCDTDRAISFLIKT